jgi:hypothetical protein
MLRSHNYVQVFLCPQYGPLPVEALGLIAEVIPTGAGQDPNLALIR